jgi:hypothetical protein
MTNERESKQAAVSTAARFLYMVVLYMAPEKRRQRLPERGLCASILIGYAQQPSTATPKPRMLWV